MRTSGTNPADLPLLDFIPTINPRYERPEHLARITELFERAEREPIRALVSVPPQHGKTETILAGLARLICRKPHLRNAYAAYGADIARQKSRQCRDMAVAGGASLREDAQTVKNWLTTEGGGLLASSTDSPLTGLPVDGVLVIDDPHKHRQDAESALSRERVYDWFNSTAKTRIHPDTSIIVQHTRWHPDDLIGRLSQERDENDKPVWEVINLPAISEDGHPLWHRRPLKFLESQRGENDYDWWSLWMGSPRRRGDAVFRGVKFYEKLPVRYRIGKGVDLAVTAKTRADWSVSVVLLREDRPNEEPLFYVVDVRRQQTEVPAFASQLEAVDAVWPGQWRWDCSTTERGVAQLLTARGIRVGGELAVTDKLVRAQPVAAVWNSGRVLVPKDAPWLKAFVDEVVSFTGVKDRHDDIVDSLSSAFASVRHSSVSHFGTISGDGSRWGSDDRGFG